jgi:hypothetical protein
MRDAPSPADFGGSCLIGDCRFDAELLLPSTTYFGLPKSGSYVYGTWRDAEGNLLRALRGVLADSSPLGFAFTSRPGSQLEHDEAAEAALWRGATSIERAGDAVTFASVGTRTEEQFTFRHEPGGCSWRDADVLAVEGEPLGPAVQWFSTWAGGACLAVTGKYRSRGTFAGRPVEGFVGHEIHYWSPGATWVDSPFGRGREYCWQQVANEYDDGSRVQATFACGADGWGFAMVHDEAGAFHCSTDVAAEATLLPNGTPETVTYHFLDQSWTWRIDPQGQRPALSEGPMIGADGTCTRSGDTRSVRYSMGNSDWWTDGRAASIVR